MKPHTMAYFTLEERTRSDTAHCTGYAFDLIPCNGRTADFHDFCRGFLADKTFDQLISEKESAPGGPSWMHVGYKGPESEQRRQFLVL